MKVTKSAVYRITITSPCTCSTMREFEDARYTKAIGKAPTFTGCKKHTGKKDLLDMLEMLLNSRLDEAAKESVPPVMRATVSTTDEETGEVTTKIKMPAQHRPAGGARLTPKTTSMAGRGAGANRTSAKSMLEEKEIELSSGSSDAMDAELAGANLGVSIDSATIRNAKDELGAADNLLDVMLADAEGR